MKHIFAALCLLAAPAAAQNAPHVVTDIAPIHALVTQLMVGVGEPSQIIPTGSSPHSYAMRPSEARALRDADLVVWVGPSLTHWLEEPLDTLSGDAARLTLMDDDRAMKLPMREATELGEEHDHGHDGHDHEGEVDPHGWLAPSNAVLWASVIAKTLADVDPANAEIYEGNSKRFAEEVGALEQEITAKLAPYHDASFIVLHDAFHYFEATFGVEADAFIVAGDGSTPGPAQIKALRDHLAEDPATCAFTAPQENDSLLRTVIEGQGTRIAVLDPMGDGTTPYATLIRQFADDMVACFSQE